MKSTLITRKLNYRLIDFWLNAYAVLTNTIIPEEIRDANTIKHFNARIRIFKDRSGLDDKEIRNLIYYCLLLDPKKFGDNKQYGKIENIFYCAKQYCNWRNKYQYELETHHIFDVIKNKLHVEIEEDDISFFQEMENAFVQ